MDVNTTEPAIDVLAKADLDLSREAAIGLMVLFSITDITNIIGNTMVLVIVFLNPRLQTNTNFFITNLCFVDLISGIILMPVVMSAITSQELRAGKLCDFVAFVDALYATASSLTIAAIALDRYHSIVNCLHYESIVTHRRTILGITWIWFQTFFISLCPIFGWGSYSFDQHQLKCSLDLPDNLGFLYFATGTSAIVPYVIIVFCYTQIHLVARRHARSMVAIHIQGTGQRIKAVSSRKTKLVYLVVGLYTICWIPFYIIKVLRSISPGLEIPPSVITTATGLSLVNGSCNPVLYALITSHYRMGINRLYRRFKRRVGRTVVSPSLDQSKSSWSLSRPLSSLYRYLQDYEPGLKLKCIVQTYAEGSISQEGGAVISKSSLRNSNIADKEEQTLLKSKAYPQTLQVPQSHRSRHKAELNSNPATSNCVNGWVVGLEFPNTDGVMEKTSDQLSTSSLENMDYDFKNRSARTRRIRIQEGKPELQDPDSDSETCNEKAQRLLSPLTRFETKAMLNTDVQRTTECGSIEYSIVPREETSGEHIGSMSKQGDVGEIQGGDKGGTASGTNKEVCVGGKPAGKLTRRMKKKKGKQGPSVAKPDKQGDETDKETGETDEHLKKYADQTIAQAGSLGGKPPQLDETTEDSGKHTDHKLMEQTEEQEAEYIEIHIDHYGNGNYENETTC